MPADPFVHYDPRNGPNSDWVDVGDVINRTV
jgi:hypothetical protein